MGDTIQQMKQQLNEFYQSLNKSQKIKIGVSGLLVITAISLMVFFTSRPEYTPLYNNLTTSDAGEMTKKLDELKIPWKNADGSENGKTTLLVPKEYYDKAKMSLAIEGFPKEGFSYEDMMSTSSLTMTNDERTKRFIIAQQNSLAQTIEEIDGVKNAIVNLSVPDDTKFLIDPQQSKASVFVNLDKGKELSKEQIDGVVMLVSNAVKGLAPDNISVVDNLGRLLNKKDSENFDATTQMGLQQQVQNDLKNSIEEFLSTVYGPGNVAVMVNVKLDFDSEVTDIKEFSPPIEGETNGIIRSMNELKEQVINGQAGGAPGTDTNSEDITQYVEGSNEASKYDKANQTINYEINELNKKIVKAQGQIKDITVAVLVNQGALVNQELTEEDKQEIINLVSASAGLDTKVVEVMARDFDNTLSKQFENANAQKGNTGLFGNIPLWAIGILLAFLVGGAGYAVYRVRQRKNEVNDLLQNQPLTVEEVIDEIDLEGSEKSGYKKEIEKFVDKKPDAVAQLLKTWLNEE
ncbi:flagellar M-ring protein FliF [Anaerosolibacter carboniphilus]|uniref:Flagellar M-ring protein n=1 Tax=Anaerosolibacter carboniphilus TaxID=1417629 RepID=A0A841KSU5_9FIRM|nr:flagellar basal-body MS-ring/collar protein FliF [Anaerosolibacter carboniphilus]MBB6216471.1 flagellar M-ring protein FliF [Anaerosolibacter carboniphilus]